jgi:processive 1,2-diacylglycerol beta-glucosyltransferase
MIAQRPFLIGRRQPSDNAHADGPILRRPGGPRVLVLSASVGTGHLRAAEAIAAALRQIAPTARIRTADVLSLSTTAFRFCYARMYLEMVRHAPTMLGYIYNRIDQPVRMGSRRWYWLRVWLEKTQLRPFLALLASEPWDLVINTFFLPAEIIASLRLRGQFSAPQSMVVTDFETHRNWVAQPCDHYFTATEEAALYLQYFGVSRAATTVTGIPVHPAFAAPLDRAACLARLGLRGGRPVVLLLAGGHGAGPIEAPYRALLEVEVPLEVVVITGRNEKARSLLGAIEVPGRHRSTVLGYTDRMHEWLAVEDLVVTKPGGLTVSEALARGVGLMLINPIPGQEERNSDFLLEQGAAVKANHLPTLAYKVTELLRHPRRLEQLKANAHRLGRPRAAFEIARCSLALVGQPDCFAAEVGN